MSPAQDVHPSGDDRFKMLDATIKRHRFAPGALIEVLHTAQELFGHLQPDILYSIAHSLKLPPSRVYGVATFYHSFRFVGSLLKLSYVSGLGAFLGVTGVLLKDIGEYMLGISRRIKQGGNKETERISPHSPHRSAGPVCRDGAEPGRFPPRRTTRASGPELATSRASVGSTEASNGRLARVGVVGPTRAVDPARFETCV
jgi:hypothetical protein